jgi:hypothetical protein
MKAPEKKIWDSIPCDRWIQWGRCVRHTVCRQLDGTLTPAKTTESFLTIRLPWKVTRFSISTDEEIRGWSRVHIRFSHAMTVDAVAVQTPRRYRESA